MNPSQVRRQFGFSAFTIEKNLEGLSQEDTLATPSDGGNCIGWVLGHVLASRDKLFASLGIPPSWDAQRAQRFQRGAPPLVDAAEAVPLEELVRIFRASQGTLMAWLEERSAEDLATEPATGPDDFLGHTLGEQLASFALHECYHGGQIAVLRRVAGKASTLT